MMNNEIKLSINEITKRLPQLDCGACGSKSCNAFAKHVETNPAELKRCIHLNTNVVKSSRCIKLPQLFCR